MKKEQFEFNELPYPTLARFGLTQEMIEDLPLCILKEIGKGGYSPVLPMRVTNENGEVIESRSRFAFIRMDSGEVDVVFYPTLKSSPLECYNEEQQKQLKEKDLTLQKLQQEMLQLRPRIDELQAFLNNSKDTLQGWLKENKKGWEENIGKLAEKQNDAGVRQLDLAIRVVDAYLRQQAARMTTLGDPEEMRTRKLMNLFSPVVDLANESAARKNAERHGVHVADSIPVDLIPPGPFWDNKWDRLSQLMSPERVDACLRGFRKRFDIPTP